MNSVLRRRLNTGLLCLALGLSACASRPTPPRSADEQFWSGRLALSIASEPAQSLSGGFELKTQAQSGELKLLSPLGNQLAQLDWAPGLARLDQGGKIYQQSSLDALLIQLTGSALPLLALIDWLQARPVQVSGWVADLSQLNNGRLHIQSEGQQPAVQLRLVLEP
jgi:outer membrane lipoprotein LolB